MPYSRRFSEFVLPEFEAQAPELWERRLREISPVVDNLAHLGFRKFEARPDWSESPFNAQPDRPMWAVYTRTPRKLVHPDKAAAMEKHWSEFATEGERVAHRLAVASSYQHFMWHSAGVLVHPFWLLQGEWGGTPMKYTDRERRVLDGAGKDSIPAPPGCFTPCVFDERAVAGITKRDRLIQAGNRLDELEKMDRPAAKKAEDDAAELLYRETVLQTLDELNAPAAEFMKSQQFKKEAEDVLRPAPAGLGNALAKFRDHYKETGHWLDASMPSLRKYHPVS